MRLPDLTKNPLKNIDTPTSLVLYLKDLVKYGRAAHTKRGTIFIMGNTAAGKSSLVNTLKKYAENTSEKPEAVLTEKNQELLETQILDLVGDVRLKTTKKLKVDVNLNTLAKSKLISLEEDNEEVTELEDLDIKMVDFGGHSEYYSCSSLFIDSHGVFVICVDSNAFDDVTIKDRFFSLVGSYIDLISETSCSPGISPKILLVATKVNPEKNCDSACEKLLEMAKSQIDTYIFEFWTIQLKILLVPGRCRVPIDYTFMPHDVENLLSI